MYNNIIHINFNKIFVRTKNFIRLFLNVKRRIFVTYKGYAKFFLITIIDDDKFRSIVSMNIKLIKLINNVYNKYIL